MFLTIHCDQVIKVLFDVLICYSGFQQSFKGKSACPDGTQEVIKCLSVFSGLQQSFKGKSACPDGTQEIKKCLSVFSMMVISNSSPKS